MDLNCRFLQRTSSLFTSKFTAALARDLWWEIQLLGIAFDT